MTGWAKAGLIIGLAVVALVALNVSMWRRMKSVIAERRGWTRADFIASLEQAGCPPPVIAVVLDTLEPFYHADVAPQMGDEIKRVLGADETEVEDWTARAFEALDLPLPSRRKPERIPEMTTVGDWAIYLAGRYDTLREGDA